MRKEIKEVVGVPEGITKTAAVLFKDIIYEMENLLDPDITEYEFSILPKKDYVVGDLSIKEINFKFNLFPKEGQRGYDIMNMGTGGESEVSRDRTKSIGMVRLSNDGVMNLEMNIVVEEDWKVDELISFLKKRRLELVGVLSHEIKHEYDSFKKPKTSMASLSDYHSSKEMLGTIRPLTEFAFNLYFTHQTENLVRPSELAAIMDEGQITKKQFLMFLLNNKTYETLDKISNFTFEKLYNNLKKYIGEIKEIFDENNVDYSEMSEDEIIQEMLSVFYYTILTHKIGIFKSGIASDVSLISDMIFDTETEKWVMGYFNKYQDKITRFHDDPMRYYKYEIKRMNRVALNMKKKLSKLYSIAKDA